MKCPLDGATMLKSDTVEGLYYCATTGKCAGSDGIYIGLIRAIRKAKKEERAAGFVEGHRTAMTDAAKIFGEAKK